MNEQRGRRVRFTLRTLLVVVAVCAVGLAIYGAIPKPELLPGICYGDEQSGMLQKLGEPGKKTFNRNGTENWIYLGSVTVHYSNGKEITLNNQPWLHWSSFGYEEWLVLTFQNGYVIDAVVVDAWDGRPMDHTTRLYPNLQL